MVYIEIVFCRVRILVIDEKPKIEKENYNRSKLSLYRYISTYVQVSIRGPKDDVEKAKLQLIELTNEKQLSSFSSEVRAKVQHHKFLIGKNGANIKKVKYMKTYVCMFYSKIFEN